MKSTGLRNCFIGSAKLEECGAISIGDPRSIALTLSIRKCEHARTLTNHEDDIYCNLNGGRGTSGQVDVPPPPTEPEITTF